MERTPRICLMLLKRLRSRFGLTLAGKLVMKRSPAMMVQPSPWYTLKLSSPVTGNASHNTPQLGHCETHMLWYSNSGQAGLLAHYKSSVHCEQSHKETHNIPVTRCTQCTSFVVVPNSHWVAHTTPSCCQHMCHSLVTPQCQADETDWSTTGFLVAM